MQVEIQNVLIIYNSGNVLKVIACNTLRKWCVHGELTPRALYSRPGMSSQAG